MTVFDIFGAGQGAFDELILTLHVAHHTQGKWIFGTLQPTAIAVQVHRNWL